MAPSRTERIATVLGLDDERRLGAYILLALAAMVLYPVIVGNWCDVDHYYVHAERVLDGEVPYSGFTFEYPPLALLLMTVPRLLSWDLGSYRIVHALMAAAFVLIAWRLLDDYGDRVAGDRRPVRLVLLLAIIAGSYFITTRNDIFAAVPALAAVLLFMKGRYVPASALIAVAAMVKLYPAILLLPMLCILLVRRQWKEAVLAVATAAAVCLLAELPFLLDDPSTAFAYLTYHSDRGFQVESMLGSLFLLAKQVLSTDITVSVLYGSDTIVGVMPDAIAPYMNGVLFAALGVFAAVIAARIARGGMPRRSQDAALGPICLAMVLLFIAFSKVYSAQYVIWVMLLAPLLLDPCLRGREQDRALGVLPWFCLASMVSYLVYGAARISGEEWICVPFVVKNVLHIVLTVAVLRLCWRATGSEKVSETLPATTTYKKRSVIHSDR